jgi:hypothetical protein
MSTKLKSEYRKKSPKEDYGPVTGHGLDVFDAVMTEETKERLFLEIYWDLYHKNKMRLDHLKNFYGTDRQLDSALDELKSSAEKELKRKYNVQYEHRWPEPENTFVMPRGGRKKRNNKRNKTLKRFNKRRL